MEFEFDSEKSAGNLRQSQEAWLIAGAGQTALGSSSGGHPGANGWREKIRDYRPAWTKTTLSDFHDARPSRAAYFGSKEPQEEGADLP